MFSIPSDSLWQFLGQTMMFEELPPSQLQQLAQIAIAQTYAKGELLFQEGDAGSGFFVVRSGRVKVFKVSRDGKEQIVHLFGAGEHFAEVPALDGAPFPASAAAILPTTVLFFPRATFLELLETDVKLAIALLKSFARHLRHFSNLIDSLVLQEVPARLASYLLDLSEQNEPNSVVELDLSKGQLAARLGTIPETLSRIFAKLSREGLIVVEGSRITLLNPLALKALAGE